MKLSALDIRKQEFAKVFRGYDPEEVDSFRHMLSQQWHLLTEDVRRLEQRIQDQTEKLEHYRKVEEALEEALQTARDGARERLEQAERKAEASIQDAESRAEATLQRAEQRAQRMVAEAEEFRRHARRTYAEASLRRNEIVKRLRMLLSAQLEQLEGFESTEDQRATMDPVDGAEDVAPPSFASAPRVVDVADPHPDEEPSIADAEPEEGPFDFRDMADFEAEPVEGRVDDEADQEEPATEGGGAGDAGDVESDEGASGADEEIRKIRRILEDLDG